MRRVPTYLPTTDALVDRARRLRRRGEGRKALVALREACMQDDQAAWMWTLYGSWLAQMGRMQDAESALAHALWVRRRNGDDARAQVTARLLSLLRSAA